MDGLRYQLLLLLMLGLFLLGFSGDRYIWRDDGARKMLDPWPDEEWDMHYCDECRRDKVENA